MSAHVPASEIETIVGATRHQTQHVIRGNYIDGTAYLLHSHECLARYRDLRDCPWSLALDRGEAVAARRPPVLRPPSRRSARSRPQPDHHPKGRPMTGMHYQRMIDADQLSGIRSDGTNNEEGKNR